MVTRRGFLARIAPLAGMAGLAGGCRGRGSRDVTGGFVDAPADPAGGPPSGTGGSDAAAVHVTVVVVGAGMAGLSAAWWLTRNGLGDCVVLEAEPVAGGNARWGETAGFRHPWGGRQVDLPLDGTGPLGTLLDDLGVLRNGVPDVGARVHAPAHRLFRWGRWRPGLLEGLVETPRERAAWRDLLDEAAAATAGASDPWTIAGPLDRVPMTAWLSDAGLELPPSLRWLVDHRCRDRYGAPASAVSARAGLAALSAPRPDEPGLSWPEGTGGLVRRLLEWLDGAGEAPAPRSGAPAGGRLVTGAPVTAVGPAVRPGRLRVDTPHRAWTCEAVVWAAPVAAGGVVDGIGAVAGAFPVEHAPWVVANLTLDGPPARRGPGPAWHNVRMGSLSTGYVPAAHQTLRTRTARSVWTWYRPVDEHEPERARERLSRRPWDGWVEEVVSDLEPAHPDVRRRLTRLDVRRLPRGTAVPFPGRLDHPARARLRDADGPVVFAHSDLAALPRVEHAVAEGVRAAGGLLDRIGGRRAPR